MTVTLSVREMALLVDALAEVVTMIPRTKHYEAVLAEFEALRKRLAQQERGEHGV